MIEDNDTGKFFKDAFDGYDSSFDSDQMFVAIENEIAQKEKPKRRVGFWIFGCAGVLGLLVVTVIIINQFPENIRNSDSSLDQTSLYIAKTLESHLQNAIKNSNPQNGNTPIDKDTTTKTIIESKSSNNIKSQSSILRPISSIYSIETSDKLNSTATLQQPIIQSERTDIIAPDVNFPNREISPSRIVQSANLLEVLPAFVISTVSSVQIDDFQVIVSQKSQSKKSKWTLGLSALYMSTLKNSSYSGTNDTEWFDHYDSSEKLHPGYNLGMDLSYKLSDKWYAVGSVFYLKAQESHAFTTENTASIFDENIINTIIVDRNNDPIDTLMGANLIETTRTQHYLVTNLEFVGIGIGVGRIFNLTPKWTLTADLQLTPYLIQQSEGQIIAPSDNALINQNDLILNGESTNLNNTVLGSQFNLSLQYQINPRLHLALRGNTQQHLGNFSDSPVLSIRRNFIGFGLNLGYQF